MTSIRRRLTHPTSLSSLALILASVTTGLSAYAFTILGIRAYGADAFAPIAIVWSVWAITVAGISSPLQHWIIQTARATGSEAPILRRSVPILTFALLGSLILGAVVGIWRDSIFGSSAWIFPVATGAAVATATLTGYVRGILGSRKRFAALSGTLAADGLLRFALAAAIVLVGMGADSLAIVVPAASLVALIWVSAFQLSSLSPTARTSTSATSGLGALAGSFLTLHLLLNAPPIVASALAAEPAVVSSLFAAFALFRAPVLIMSVLSTKVSYLLATYAAEGRDSSLDRFRRRVGGITVGGIVLGGIVGGAPAIWALRFVYGDDMALSATEARLIVAGSVAAVGVLLLLLLTAARAVPTAALLPLLAGVIMGAVWLAIASALDPGLRVASGFLLSATTALLGLAWMDRHVTTQRRSAVDDHPLPGDGIIRP